MTQVPPLPRLTLHAPPPLPTRHDPQLIIPSPLASGQEDRIAKSIKKKLVRPVSRLPGDAYAKLPLRSKQPRVVDRWGIVSPYAYEPRPTIELEQCADAAGVAMEDLTLPAPCELLLSTITTTELPPRSMVPNVDRDDLLSFESTSDMEAALMAQSYKNFFGLAVSRNLENELEKLPQGVLKPDDNYVWPASHIEAGIKVLAEIQLPAADFFVIFGKKASVQERDRFHETRKAGHARMLVEFKTLSPLVRSCGVAAVRVWLAKQQRYRIVRAPVLMSLDGNVVRIMGVIDVFDDKNVPDEWRIAPRGEKPKKGTDKDEGTGGDVPSSPNVTSPQS